MPREKEGSLEKISGIVDSFSNLGKSAILAGYGVAAWKGFNFANDYLSDIFDEVGQYPSYSLNVAYAGILEVGIIGAFVGGGIVLAKYLFKD